MLPSMYNLRRGYFFMQFTEDQKIALKHLDRFLCDDNAQQQVLAGSAGCGKTFTITSMLKERHNLRVVFLAPTHKARKVIADMLVKNELYGIEAFTLHSYLGLAPKTDIKTGKNVFLPTQKTFDTDFTVNDLVIADEASMYRKDEYQLCLTYLPKVLWVGDSYQLPPVSEENERISQPFIWGRKNRGYYFELGEIVRYSGEILFLCNEIRDNVPSGLCPYYRKYNNQVKTLPIKTWKGKALDLFKSEEFKVNADFCKVISYRNEVVINHNYYFRDMLFGDDAVSTYLPNEVLICKNPIVRTDERGNDKIILQTSQEVRVLDVDIARDDGYVWYFLTVVDERGINYDLQTIHESSKEVWDLKLQQLNGEASREKDKIRRIKLWKVRNEFQNRNDQLRHSYSITANASQGSTYNYVFCDSQDILNNRDGEEMLKRLYVGCSRAKDSLYLL